MKPKSKQMLTGPAFEIVMSEQLIKKGDWIRIGKMISQTDQSINGRIYRVHKVVYRGDNCQRYEFYIFFGGKPDGGLIYSIELDGWYPGEVK